MKLIILKNTGLRNQLFNEKNIPYSTLHSNRIRKIIFENKDVISFIDNVEYSIRQYPNFLKRELIDKMMELVIPKEEKILANKLYDLLKDTPLIDYYSAYQILSDYWSVISLDLELLQIEGIDSLTKVDPKMVSKKNSKTKEMYEVQDGWVGRILTFEQIQESYFKDLKAKLDIIVENLDEFESEKTSLLELIDPNDKSELINEDGNIVAKKLNAVISKIKKELKNGAEFEEDTYEDIIIKINEINESIKSSKKEKKALQEKLITDTKTKIESLTEEEAIYNLVNKWINPLCDKLNYLSNEVVNNLAEKIDYLNTKYMVTYEEITKNIEVSKTNLSSMMYDLKGNQFDMKGINKFIKIINGDNNE